jgi:hypothetical protein
MLETQQTHDSVLQINHAYAYYYKSFKEPTSQTFSCEDNKTIMHTINKNSCICEDAKKIEQFTKIILYEGIYN